jgi:serine/threonine-protein kinase
MPDLAEKHDGVDQGRLSAERIRDQVEKILASRSFAQAPMLSRLLRYLVERTISGHTDDLKEYAVGVEVFDRGPSFDPRTDTIVRVQARRLRARLQDYYRDEGAEDPILLDLPKGRYVVQCRRAAADERPTAPRVGSKGADENPPPAGRSVATGSTSTSAGRSIAVLPFANLSRDPDNEYFTDGLTEEIISALASVPDIRVVARTSAFRFKGRAEDIRTIGRDLGVETALEGSVRKEGRRIRATAQLINVADGFHLWSQTYDRELTGVFTIQEEITEAIVSALQLRLAASDAATSGNVPVVPTAEAYEWYLKGRYFYHKATSRALAKAVECMERAIACDPRYAAAYAGLADACVTWMSLAVERAPSELLTKARESARQALQLDPQSAEAHCSLGEVLAVADWDLAAAERRFQQALHLKPSFVHARMAYSVVCLSPLRRHDESLAQLRLALRSDPMSTLLQTMLGQALVLAGKADQAVEQLRHVLELDPQYTFAYYTLALACVAESRLDEALDILQRMPDPGPSHNHAGHLGYTRGRLGDRAGAELMLQQLLQRAWVPAVDVAAIYNGLGDAENAIVWLRRAREAREFDALFLRDDPRFQNLQTDPAFLRAMET